jgi:hypothetical protein
MALSIYQLGVYTAHYVRGESLESIAEKLGKPVASIKKTWYFAKMTLAAMEGKPKKVFVPDSQARRNLRAFAEVEFEVAKGLRCEKCKILFPADCTPAKCVARELPMEQYDALCALIRAVMAS